MTDYCKECGQEIYVYEKPEEFELRIKKDIPKDALCHTCTHVCVFHEARHYKCSAHEKKA